MTPKAQGLLEGLRFVLYFRQFRITRFGWLKLVSLYVFVYMITLPHNLTTEIGIVSLCGYVFCSVMSMYYFVFHAKAFNYVLLLEHFFRSLFHN